MTHPPRRPPNRDHVADTPIDDSLGSVDTSLARAVATLRQLPDAPPGAVDRVVAAALVRNGVPGMRRHTATSWFARAAAIMLAAGLGASGAYITFYRDATSADSATVASMPSSSRATDSALRLDNSAAPSAVAYAAAAAEEAPVPTAFALVRPNARRVAVVGDFNRWDTGGTLLTQDSLGVWTGTVPLAPGRHAYVFVVDDSIWVTDPRAEVVHDQDYGRDHSVVLVSRP